MNRSEIRTVLQPPPPPPNSPPPLISPIPKLPFPLLKFSIFTTPPLRISDPLRNPYSPNRLLSTMKKQTRRRKKKPDPKHDADKKAVAAVSVDDAVSALHEANGDADKAAEIIFADDLFTTSSSSADDQFSTSSTSGSGGSERCRNKEKRRVIASAGTVANVLGKEYVWSRMTKLSGKKTGDDDENGAVNQEEAEQFLCSMLGDESELNMAVIRDVLCQCGYDVEKALDCLLEVSESSSSIYSSIYREDGRYPTGQLDYLDTLTDRASDCTSYSSEDNIWYSGYSRRNYAEVLASSEAHPRTSPSSDQSNIPQKVLESLFNMSKTEEYEPKAMNWKNVVNKMRLLGPEFDGCTSSSSVAKQDTLAKGDEYHEFRGPAKQHWDSMKAYYQKAATAYSKGSREHAGYLSEQGRLQTKIAQKADEKASQQIFKARNRDIENVITIDLHGQHVKQAMKLLKIHLLFGTYAQSVQILRVITGCGSHGLGKSKLKQSVVQLVEKEGIPWSEENRGVVLIKLGSHSEFNFLDSENDDE